MAVPFRAKDVAVENTEFGRPHVALILTQLSYYYNGLNDQQLMQCLNRLNDEEEDQLSNIQHWKSINLKNSQQTNECLFIICP